MIRYVCALLAVLLAATSFRPAMAEQQERDFSIPRESLDHALIRFAIQANLSVDYTGVRLQGLESTAVSGRMSPQAALRDLLRGTGLAFEFAGTSAVRISPREAPVPEAPSKPAPKPQLAQITVTATKRAEDLQTLATSAGVVPQMVLADADITTSRRVADYVAGLSSTNMGPGRNKLFVRGLSDGSFTGRTQSTIGIYLDDTPVSFTSQNPDLRLIDMAQVEVLRGPQGALYGSGAIAGVYRMVTNKPDLDRFSGNVALGGSVLDGGGPGGFGRAVFNVPLVEQRLGLRLVAYLDESGGYVDNARLNLRRVNAARVWGARAALRWEPSDTLTIDLSGTIQDTDQDDTQYYEAALGPFRQDNYLPQPYADHIRIGTVTVRKDLDWAKLTSATSVIDRGVNATLDATLGIGKFVPLEGIPSPFVTNRNLQQFSHESRLVSAGNGRLRWLLGGFFQHFREHRSTELTVPGAGAVFGGQGFPSDVVYQELLRETAVEVAAFGEIEWYFADSWSLTLGGRAFHNRLAASSNASGVSVGETQAVGGKSRHNGVVPKVAVSYSPSDDLLLYARVEEGFRSGGVNINTPTSALFVDREEGQAKVDTFLSDELWNYEFGLKSQWLDQRLRLNAAVFYVVWRDIQSDQLLPNGLGYIVNAGDGRNWGVEVELEFHPVDALQIRANLLVNSPDITIPNPVLGSQKGAGLPGVADLTAGLGVDYAFSLPGDFTATVSFDYAYVGRSSLVFSETNKALLMGGYHVGNLRLGVARGPIDFGIQIDNLWNAKGNTFSFGNPFSLPFQDQRTPVEPRKIGLYVGYRF